MFGNEIVNYNTRTFEFRVHSTPRCALPQKIGFVLSVDDIKGEEEFYSIFRKMDNIKLTF